MGGWEVRKIQCLAPTPTQDQVNDILWEWGVRVVVVVVVLVFGFFLAP